MLLSNGAPAWGGGNTPSGYGGLADATPVYSNASYYATGQMPLSGQWQAYGQLYRTQLWVNTLVRKLAFATARLPYQVRRRRPGNQQVPEPGSFADLMARPNERVDAFRLWLWTSSTYDVYGEAFWWKIRRPDGTVGRLELLHPTNILIRRNPDDSLEYLYTTGSQYSQMPPIPAEDIVPFTNYNPENLQRGLSNLEPLRQTLLNEDASRRATSSFWQRGARPSVALKHPSTLSQPAQDRLRASWEARHAGADLMGGTAILEEGMEAQVIQLSAEEMQYIESRKLNREEVCAAFDVPPPVVHILDHATFCLPAGSLVSTARGPVPIAAVTVDDRVWSLTDGGLQLRDVLVAHQTGVKPLLTVRSQNRTLHCTDNHPLLVRRTSRLPRGQGITVGASYRHEHVWVPAGELKVGDIIVTVGALPEVGGDSCPTRTVTEGFAEFAGLLLGDGNINYDVHGRPSGATIARGQSATYMDHYRRVIVDEFVGRGNRPVRLQEMDRQTRFSSAAAGRELAALGLAGTARTKRVPEWVFGLSDKLRLAVLRGYLDADGSCDKKGRLSYSSVNPTLLGQMRAMCIGLGVPVTNLRLQEGFTTLPNGTSHPVAQWSFTCSDPGQNTRIGSHDSRYQERLAAGTPFGEGSLATYYAYRPHGRPLPVPVDCGHAKVVSIGSSGPVPVYDIEVQGSHNFIAEGVVVHNSNITEQLRSMYRDTMAPRFGLFESVVDHHLAPDFDSTGEVFGRFDMDDVLRGDFETRAEAVTKLVGVGILKPSEGRPMFSLPEAGPEADRLYANAALVPLGSTPTPVTAPAAPPVLQAVRSVRLPPDGKAVRILARVGRDKPNVRQILVDEHRKALTGYFDRQHAAVKTALTSKAVFDPAGWDDDLSGVLLTLSTATSQAIGGAVARQLDGTYDAADIADWLHTDAGKTATLMNRTTADQLQAALDNAEPGADPAGVVDGLYDGPVAARAEQASLSRVALVAGLAGLVAGRQSGATTKTWSVNSAKPRPSHAQMHGETVSLPDPFSNGMNAPGDPAGGADEVAGCTCSLDIGK